MSIEYHYRRLGVEYGPVSPVRLRELASRGELDREDLVRKAGDQQWRAARNFKGLFSEEQAIVLEVAEEIGVGSGTRGRRPVAPDKVMYAAEVIAPPVVPADPTPGAVAPPSPGNLAGIQQRLLKVRPLAEKYSREFELPMRPFLAAAAGSACLFLLALSSFLVWDHWSLEMGGALKGAGDAVSYRGMQVWEGKWVCFLSCVGIAGFLATILVKRILPIGVLTAAAVGTCSLLMSMSFRHQINSANAEIARQTAQVKKNFAASFGTKGGNELGDQLIPQESSVAGLGLSLATLSSLVVAATFVFVSLLNPMTLPFLQKDSLHPLARKHGAMIATQGLAVLIGLLNYVIRF